MSWQGGGKHRGTPTPEFDKMALEGMRFWTAYAKFSCTPSRIAIKTGRHCDVTGIEERGLEYCPVSANAGGFTAFYTRTCRSLIVCEGQELAVPGSTVNITKVIKATC